MVANGSSLKAPLVLVEDYGKVVEQLRENFLSGLNNDFEQRKKHLKQLRAFIQEREKELADALKKDLNKPLTEALLNETDFLLGEIDHTLSELKTWMRPEKVSRNFMQAFDGAYVHREPLGVVLIIGAWNYPVQLLLGPLIGALAAGCTAVLKPSELSPVTSSLIATGLREFLDESVVRVLEGGVPETTELLRHRFDHIFYTGSTVVGKVIMKAASEFLTPVTLELGGKSPVIVAEDAPLENVGRRLAWGKLVNAGQTCITADYVLVVDKGDKKRRDELVEAVRVAVEEFYGKEPGQSPDYGHIVNERHFDRLKKLLDGTKGKVVIGGETQREQLFIAPTVVVDVDREDILMKDELFGPILPVLTVSSVTEAVDFVKKGEKPLALYVFSDDSKLVEKVVSGTSSGSVCVNDLLMQMCLETLPFGGVGHSGMGHYHGRYTFDTFTHEKAVLHSGSGMEKLKSIRYPPYSETKLSWARRLQAKWRVPFLG